MQEVAADVVSSATHRSGGQAGSCPAVDVTLV